MSSMEYWRKTDLLPFLIKMQDSQCGICHEQFEKPEDATIDHDHQTGQIRGVLCAPCNRGLGQFGDSIVKLMAAAEYLADEDSQDTINKFLEARSRQLNKEKVQRLNMAKQRLES